MKRRTKTLGRLVGLLALAGGWSAAYAAPPACSPGAFEAEANGFSVKAALKPASRQVAVGSTLSIVLKANRDARVVIYNVTADGKVQSLVETGVSGNGLTLKKDELVHIPGPGRVLRVAEPLGRNRIVVSFEQVAANPFATPGVLNTFDQQPKGLLVTHLSGGSVLEGAICFDVIAE